jgi:hypothetical protein
MEFQGWLQTGVVLLLLIGGYLLIRRPLQRKQLFDLAAGKLKRRRHAHFTRKPSQPSRR